MASMRWIGRSQLAFLLAAAPAAAVVPTGELRLLRQASDDFSTGNRSDILLAATFRLDRQAPKPGCGEGEERDRGEHEPRGHERGEHEALPQHRAEPCQADHDGARRDRHHPSRN